MFSSAFVVCWQDYVKTTHLIFQKNRWKGCTYRSL